MVLQYDIIKQKIMCKFNLFVYWIVYRTTKKKPYIKIWEWGPMGWYLKSCKRATTGNIRVQVGCLGG